MIPAAMSQKSNRRRVFAIVAGSAALAMTSGRRDRGTWQWSGHALGAEARITFNDPDRDKVGASLAAVRLEIERLEAEFSLYRTDSAISRLNASSILKEPSIDFSIVVEIARALGKASEGAFDITVQSALPALARARDDQERAELALGLRHRVGWEHLNRCNRKISLTSGSAITLNGVAQGYIADRVAAILQDLGWRHVLIDVGEVVALGPLENGTPWPLRVVSPSGLGAGTLIDLARGAVATTAPQATRFAPGSSYTHIIDPHSLRSESRVDFVTVHAPTAMIADGVSTALALIPWQLAPDILRAFGANWARAQFADGSRAEIRI